jgi:hypothetical protein
VKWLGSGSANGLVWSGAADGLERGALAKTRDLLLGQLNSAGWLVPVTRSSAMSGAARTLSGQQATTSAAKKRQRTGVKKYIR